MKKRHVHKPDVTMAEICDNCGYGYTYCTNCVNVIFTTQDGGKTWIKD